MIVRIRFFALALFAAALSSSAGADDWAGWRGPFGNGISPETGLPSTWDPDTGENVVWEKEIGGRSTPVVLNGRVYINCRTLDDVTDPVEGVHAREQVVCFDAESGEVVWQDIFNVFQTDIPAPRVGWASMVGDPETGNVYVHSVSGLFKCYDKDGNKLWERSLLEEYGKISGYGGRTQTPIIDEDRIIVGFFGLSWGKLAAPPPRMTYFAFDKKTGEHLWSAPVGGAPDDTTYSNPVIAIVDGQRMLVGGGADGAVQAINARTGEALWSFGMSKRGLNTTPVIYNNRVYISHGEDNIDSLDFGRVECIDATGRGDVTKTHSVWRVNNVKAGYTGMLLKDDILYVVADTGNLHAFDAENGTELWKFSLGTVGKGAPVWADGKIYVTEVNGRIHILKPSREGCESLCSVELLALQGEGVDEIYGSPAVSNGRVYFTTRDRTICIADADAEHSRIEFPDPLAGEVAPTDTVATLRLIPAETYTVGGGEVQYEIRGYDANGRYVKNLEGDISLPETGLAGVAVDGLNVTVPPETAEGAGEVTVTVGELSATARLRVIPNTPWDWNFDGYKGTQVPPTWIAGFLKLKPMDLDGEAVMGNTPGRGKPSIYIWIGPPNMSGYTVEADVRMTEQKRKLPSIGVTAQRYNLILKGNNGKVAVQSWAPHLRMSKEVSFRSDPDVWYHMKLTVDVRDDGAHVLGKVWKRGEDEPEDWTIEAIDPHPNETGSPGIYVYSLAESFIDNVKVTGGEASGPEIIESTR